MEREMEREGGVGHLGHMDCRKDLGFDPERGGSHGGL
jgi:hypothetical protein